MPSRAHSRRHGNLWDGNGIPFPKLPPRLRRIPFHFEAGSEIVMEGTGDSRRLNRKRRSASRETPDKTPQERACEAWRRTWSLEARHQGRVRDVRP